MRAAAGLLAGGAGRRLGGLPKEALELADGRPMGPALAQALRGAFAPVLVVTNSPELYEGPGIETLRDLEPGFGPLSGLHAALSALAGRGGPAWLWLAACDMPFFDARLPDFLGGRLEAAVEAAAREGAVAPLACLARKGGHFEPFGAFYSTALLGPLGELFARTRAARAADPAAAREIRDPSFKELLAGRPALFVAESEVRALSPDWGLFLNINTPEDLAAFRRRALEGMGREGKPFA